MTTAEGDIESFDTTDNNDLLLGSAERYVFNEQEVLLGQAERYVFNEEDLLAGQVERRIFKEEEGETLVLHLGNHSAAVLKTPHQNQTFDDAGNIPFEYKIKNLENIDSSINLLLNDSVVETQSLSGEVTETFTSEHDAGLGSNTYSTEVTKDDTGETDASGQITFETLSVAAGSIFRTFNGVIETDNGVFQTQ